MNQQTLAGFEKYGKTTRRAQFLAEMEQVCPTCCAKWRYARASSEAEVITALRTAQSPQITVMLAGEATVIRFVQIHLEDLRTMISAISETAS
jgi:hypothetical protein